MPIAPRSPLKIWGWTFRPSSTPAPVAAALWRARRSSWASGSRTARALPASRRQSGSRPWRSACRPVKVLCWKTITCDAVAMSGGWSPVVHLWSHCGGKLSWDDEQAMFRPDVDNAPTGAGGEGFVRCAGTAEGHLDLDDVLKTPMRRARRRPVRRVTRPSAARRRSGTIRERPDRAGLADAAGRGRQAADEGVAGLPERRQGQRCSAGRARGL